MSLGEKNRSSNYNTGITESSEFVSLVLNCCLVSLIYSDEFDIETLAKIDILVFACLFTKSITKILNIVPTSVRGNPLI